METPDVFEDVASDDSDGSNDSDVGDFSDDAIASVLDLMTERASARLNAIDEADDSTERSSDSVASVSLAARIGHSVPLVSTDTSTRPASPPVCATMPPHDSARSALALLDELFPLLAPSDALASPNSSSSSPEPALALAVTLRTPPSKTTSDSDSEQQPEWLSSLLEATTSSVATEAVDAPAFAPAPITKQAPSSGNTRADEQPKWMRALLDEMYADSTKPQSPKSPHRSPVRESASSDSTARLSATSASPAVMDAPMLVLPSHTEASAPLPLPANDQELHHDTPPALEIINTTDAASGITSASSVSSSLRGNASSACSSLTWGRFSPDKMPVRTTIEPLCLVKASRTSSSKRLCYVPLVRSQRRRVRPRVVTPADSELTFRPKINVRYLAYVVATLFPLSLVHRIY